jgi:hypothetical protein
MDHTPMALETKPVTQKLTMTAKTLPVNSIEDSPWPWVLMLWLWLSWSSACAKRGCRSMLSLLAAREVVMMSRVRFLS